jgi:radical SAM superfamily enzyme YgiQ (UPF0313 family)
MLMRITFVHAPEEFYDQNYGTQFIPLWAFYLSSFVPQNWEIDLIDCRLEHLSNAKNSDVFAIGGINQSLNKMLAVKANLEKRFPKAKYIIGGPIAWSFEQENKLHLLDTFDHIFILDGEQSLQDYLKKVETSEDTTFPKIVKYPRYPIGQARKLSFELFDRKSLKYYGAVIEVSRGCPFLCEFCDIRVLPGNNQANNKSVELIISEIDNFFQRGIREFQFACDNFIGDLKWANECVDAILEWKIKNNANISIFTWLTINLYNYEDLMSKMRKAGFGILFIGIESVNQNSLLETAKVQNMNVLAQAVKTIHSFGFVIAPGLIFGFDSDDENLFKDTLAFLKETGTVGGDPSFLTALAGTPLFSRMKKSGRLIERSNQAVERKKIETNIKYMQDKDFLTSGFIGFVKEFCSSRYQLERINNTIHLITSSNKFIGTSKGGAYAALGPYLLLQLKNWENFKMLMRRVTYLCRPDRFAVVVMTMIRFKLLGNKFPGIGNFFSYWVYNWTNMVLKYGKIREQDFRLHTVDKDFDLSMLLTSAEVSDQERQIMESQGVKVNVQSKRTLKALEKVVFEKKKEIGRTV